MRKKILYGILFLTLFLVSTASMVQPVYAYEIGIPDEAIDVDLVAEIKIFNEDEWEKCIGKDGLGPDEIWEGDADVVGARQLVIFRDVGDVDGTGGPEDHDLGDEVPVIEAVLRNAGLLDTIDTLLVPGFTGLAQFSALAGGLANATLGGNAIAESLMYAGALTQLKNSTQILAAYGKEYEGGVLWRDRWFYNEDWETDDDYGDVDETDLSAEHKWKGWGPILNDPRDRRDAQLTMAAMKNDVLQTFDALRGPLINAYLQYFQGTAIPAWPANQMDKVGQYDALNDTIAAYTLDPDGPGPAPTMPLIDPDFTGPAMGVVQAPIIPMNWSIAHGGSDHKYGDYVYTLFNFLDLSLASMAVAMQYAAPFDNKLAMYISMGPDGGMPCLCDSAEDYVRRMTEEFNFDDETLYGMPWTKGEADLNSDGTINAAPVGSLNNFMFPLGGETIYAECYADVSVEGATVTIEIEWPDDQIDPADDVRLGGDGEDELDDFEIIYAVNVDIGLGGGYVKSGDSIIWQAGSVDQIPGYEITILLGASAISVLALVYIIMKKRKR